MIVLDSSFLIAYHNERDAHHLVARELMRQFLADRWGGGFLLEYVFMEVMTVLMVRRDLSTATRVGRILLDAQELDFVSCSDLFVETMDCFSGQTGTQLSFADAAITRVARSRAGGQVLTFDKEFRKIADLHVFPD